MANEMRAAWDCQMALPNGGRLGFSDLGEPSGRPVLFIGGFPGSRLMAGLFEDFLNAGYRIIGLDRPGAGLSSFRGGWGLPDWADEVGYLIDRLGLREPAVLGWSGGTPYALACALRLGGQVTACGVIACMPPPEMALQGAMARNQVWKSLAQKAPTLLGPLLWLLYGRLGADPEKFRAALERMQPELSEPDRAAYAHPRVMDTMARAMAEAYRQGVATQAYEAKSLFRPWGFELEDIDRTAVYLWHGEQDRNIPVEAGQAVASRIPGCQSTFLPGEGHLSILTQRGGEILKRLTGSLTTRPAGG